MPHARDLPATGFLAPCRQAPNRLRSELECQGCYSMRLQRDSSGLPPIIVILRYNILPTSPTFQPFTLLAGGQWVVLRQVLKLGDSGHAVLCNTRSPNALINRYARDGGQRPAPDDESCSGTNDIERRMNQDLSFPRVTRILRYFPTLGVVPSLAGWCAICRYCTLSPLRIKSTEYLRPP